MNLSRILSLTVLLTTPLAAAVAGSNAHRSVAIVYSLAGEASLTTPGAAPRPLRLFDRLPAGTIVEVSQGARVALAFVTGNRYVLSERSKVTLGGNDLAARSGPLLALPPIPPLPFLAPLAPEDHPGPRAGAVRIRGERIAGLYPDHGAATLAAATVLRFQPVAGESRYRVEVQDQRGKWVYAVETKGSVAALPGDLLQPGMRYDWTVRTVERAGPVAQGQAEFVTLSAAVAEQREALRKALTAEGDGASWALLAEVDRSLGLLAEARDELREAAQRSPGDTLLARNLNRLERSWSYRQSP